MKTSKPLFRFAHATDLHYEIGSNPAVPEANARTSCLINDINAHNSKNPLSCVILSGDLSNRGAAKKDELSEAKSQCDRLQVPYYAIAGNHDLAPNRKHAAMYPVKEAYHEGTLRTSNFGRIFGAHGIRFSFAKDHIHFIGVSLRDKDPDGVLDWLEEEVNGIQGQGIIVSHYGLYPPRDAGPLHTWGFARIGDILPRLRSIISNSGTKILAYLYGHNHINSVVERNGTYHISGGGIQKGCTGYRVFNCYEKRIESSFHLLSDDALWDFNYWGRERPEECIDSSHKTVEEYHRGSVDEQSFTIAMASDQ
jgi:DNA repair exonuclease SbcCD nuclease subunit